MKTKLFGVLSSATLIGGILTGCGGADVKEVSNSSGSKQEQKVNDKKEEKKPAFYKIGQTVSVDGMEITINKVTWGKPSEYEPAKKGKILRIEATAKNNAVDNGFVDNTEFQAYADDAKQEGYFGSEDSTTLAGGELKKGKSMNIVMEFDVPEAEKYEIFYEPSFTLKENAEIKWELAKGEIK